MSRLMIKIWSVVDEEYLHDEQDGLLILYPTEGECKEMLRKEGFREDVIELAYEYHPHYAIDEDGYELDSDNLKS